MKKSYLFLFFGLLLFSFINCVDEKQGEVQGEKPFAESSMNAADYEIVKVEDQSRKALGNKSLSQYETSEIEKLPVNKKMLYRIVLPERINSNEVVPTVNRIIQDLTSEDTDIDEIILWLYSNKDIANSTYDIGTAIWAPAGKLGNVDAYIAQSNNRRGYEIDYQVKENLDEYITQKSKTEIKFGMSEEERKQFFKAIVKAEDKANLYSRQNQDKVLAKNLGMDQTRTELDKIDKEVEDLMTRYKSEVRLQYDLTKEQEKEIVNEAFAENWPLD